MSEEKRMPERRGRVYSDDSRRYVQELELKRRKRVESSQVHQEAGSKGRFMDGPGQSRQPGQGRTRRREQENWQKMKILLVILGVLVACLIAAIVYEIVLGYGTRETGGQRMAQTQELEQEGAAVQNESGTGSADPAESQEPEQGGVAAQNESGTGTADSAEDQE